MMVGSPPYRRCHTACAEEDRRGRFLHRVFGREDPAERGVGAEHGKEIRRDQPDAQLFRFRVAVERRGVRPDRAEAGEQRPALAQIVQLRARERRARVAGVGQVAPDEDQPRRVAERQRRDQHRVDAAEDGGVGADAERQRGDDDERDARRAHEAAARVADVLERGVDSVPHAATAHFLADRFHAVHLDERGAPCGSRLRAVADLSFDQLVEEAAQLLVQIVIQLVLPHERSPDAGEPPHRGHRERLRS